MEQNSKEREDKLDDELIRGLSTFGVTPQFYQLQSFKNVKRTREASEQTQTIIEKQSGEIKDINQEIKKMQNSSKWWSITTIVIATATLIVALIALFV
jgi:hypothetical protein